MICFGMGASKRKARRMFTLPGCKGHLCFDCVQKVPSQLLSLGTSEIVFAVAVVFVRRDGSIDEEIHVAYDARALGHAPYSNKLRLRENCLGISPLGTALQILNCHAANAVFPGNRSAQEATCPHCRRAVDGYAYAFWATQRSVSCLQDKLSHSETEVNRMKKHLAIAKIEVEQATRRVDDWCKWSTAAKGFLQAMPPSSMPHVHVGPPPQVESETARSRSPRQVRTSGVVYPEYNG